MKPHTAIIGGGLAGVTTAWQLHRLGMPFTLYEASPRLGGTLRTIHRDGFLIEMGPDGWVTEKPWAAELATEVGLAPHLQGSLDEGRVTHIARSGSLHPMPESMRMMVPSNLTALEHHDLITPETLAAYRAEPARAEELKRTAPHTDESIATFVLRHFGPDVLTQIAAPLLSGIFGGSVHQLSVRAVMPQFVAMEHEHGSLITALQLRAPQTQERTIFTALATGVEAFIDRMVAELPPGSIRLNSVIKGLISDGGGWIISSDLQKFEACDHLILATPSHTTAHLLNHGSGSPDAADLLPTRSSSAILVALAFDDHFPLPPGFGFLVPEGSGSPLLACTFVDQKYPHRVPPGKRLLRAFFGGHAALPLMSNDDSTLTTLALTGLEKLLGPLPTPAFSIVQRWPFSLPQYGVGHIERIARLRTALPRDLHLVGNAYRGVGIPDLIREARATARHIASVSS